MLRLPARSPLAARATTASLPRHSLVASAPRAPSCRAAAVVAEAGGEKPPGKGGRKKSRSSALPALPALASPSPAASPHCDWPPAGFPGLLSSATGGVGLDRAAGGGSAGTTGAFALTDDSSVEERLGAGGHREHPRSSTGSVSVCGGKHCRKDGTRPPRGRDAPVARPRRPQQRARAFHLAPRNELSTDRQTRRR